MNPARLHALFNAYFLTPGISAPQAEPANSAAAQPRSLAAYLMGGV